MKILLRAVFILVFILSCATRAWTAETVKFESEIKENLAVPLDAALTGTGNLFVLDSGTSVFAFDVENKPQLSFKLPITPSVTGQTVFPAAMALAPKGALIVADIPNNRVQVFNLAGEFLFSFGTAGVLPGQFKSLSGVDVDTLGFIYTADLGTKRVQVFTPNGVYMRSVALSDTSADVAVDLRGNIYALLSREGKIEKFTNDGRKITQIICRANNSDEIAKATRFHVDPWGDIYLTQPGEERIVKIDQNGNVLIRFGSEGNARGQFAGISGLFADLSGRVYVADAGNARIQIFKLIAPAKTPMSKLTSAPFFLEFESTVDAPEAVSDIFLRPGKGLFSISDKRGTVNVLDRSELVIGAEGSGAGQLLRPGAVHAALDGRIYVADTGNNRVSIFNSDGTPFYEFGKNGSKPGQFNAPQGIVVNGKGMIYVADTLNNRVQVFNHDGIYLSAIGMGSADKEVQGCEILKLPKALAVDSNDNLYVLESENAQVKVFDEKGQCLKTIGEKGDDPGQFSQPSDIAVDQNDNFYVADPSDAQVHIFDRNGKFLLSFGSVGVGHGYFKQLSSITAAEGKIYVSDYQNNVVQVFRYAPDGLMSRSERLYATKTAPPADNAEMNDVLRYSIARKTAYQDAVRDLVQGLGFSENYIVRFVRIESIENLNDGHVKVTVSVPKFIPKEILPVDDSSSK